MSQMKQEMLYKCRKINMYLFEAKTMKITFEQKNSNQPIEISKSKSWLTMHKHYEPKFHYHYYETMNVAGSFHVNVAMECFFETGKL